jgi:GNAT superfamily N-acetyltransferase
MPLVLRPISTADTLSWTRIRAKAYLGPTHELIHSGPISEFSILKVAEGRKREVGKPNHWQWKIVDTDLSPSPDDPPDNGGQTIAIAVWSRHNADSTREHTVAEPTAVPTEKPEGTEGEKPFIPPEVRLEVLDALFTPLRKAQSEIMGDRPYFMLNSFATHPDHHRKGAGTMLLNWGLDKADEEGWVTYLDTTTLARPIYEKRGFTVVTAFEFDRRPWGGEGMDWHGCMIRQPRPKQS